MKKIFIYIFLIFGIMGFPIEMTKEYKDELFYDLITNSYNEKDICNLIDKYNYSFRKNDRYSYNMDDLIVAAINNETENYSLDFIKELDSIYLDNWNIRYNNYNNINLYTPYKYALEHSRFDIFDYFLKQSYEIPNYKESIFKSDIFLGLLDSINHGNSLEVIDYLKSRGLNADFNYFENDVYRYLASLDLITFENLYKISNIKEFLKKENSYEKILLSYSSNLNMKDQKEFLDFLFSKIDIENLISGIDGFENNKEIQAEIFFYIYKKGIQPDKRIIDFYFSYLNDYAMMIDSVELYLIYYTMDKINQTEKRFDQKNIIDYIISNDLNDLSFVLKEDELKKLLDVSLYSNPKNDKYFYLSKINSLILSKHYSLAKEYLLEGINKDFFTIEDVALYYDFKGIEDYFVDFLILNDVDLNYKTKFKTLDRNIDLMEYFIEKNLFYKNFLKIYDGNFKNLFYSAIKYSSIETIEYLINNFEDKVPADKSSVLYYFRAAAQSKNSEKFYFVQNVFNVEEYESYVIERLIYNNWDLSFIEKIMNKSKIDYSEEANKFLSVAVSNYKNPKIFELFQSKNIFLNKEEVYSFGNPIKLAILNNSSFSMKKYLINYYGVNYSDNDNYSLLSDINPDYYQTIKYIYEHEDFKYTDMVYQKNYDLLDKKILDSFDIKARFIVESGNILVIDYFINKIKRINMLSYNWRSLLDFAVINDNYYAQKYILLNNYDLDYGIAGIGSDEIRIGDVESNNVFHFLARSDSYNYFNNYFYNLVSDEDVQKMMKIPNSGRIIPLMYHFKFSHFKDLNNTAFFLYYKGFENLDYNNNNFLHYYAMNKNIFSYFKDYVYKDNLPSELFKTKNKDGFTPYELAVEMGNMEKAEHIKKLQEYYK